MAESLRVFVEREGCDDVLVDVEAGEGGHGALAAAVVAALGLAPPEDWEVLVEGGVVDPQAATAPLRAEARLRPAAVARARLRSAGTDLPAYDERSCGEYCAAFDDFMARGETSAAASLLRCVPSPPRPWVRKRFLAACRKNDATAAAAFLEAGAVDPLASYGPAQRTALAYAAEAGAEEVCALLLDHCGAAEAAGRADFVGMTPLHHASAAGHVGVAAALIAAGAAVDVADDTQRTPLALAMACHEADRGAPQAGLASLLLAAGADPDARDRDGATPLMRAALFGLTDACQVLLEAGAAVGAKCHAGTPLALAAAAGHAAAVRVFLSHGAAVDARDDDGATPLLRAAWGMHEGACRVLLEHGADPRAENDEGETAAAFLVARGLSDGGEG